MGLIYSYEDPTDWRWACPCGRWVRHDSVVEQEGFTAHGPAIRVTGFCSRCGNVDKVRLVPTRWPERAA